MPSEPLSPEPLRETIQGAAEKSGLTADAIRVWERRYQAVVPERSASNQRIYSEADIGRLTLLKQLTESGRRISSLANLSTEALVSLLESGQVKPKASSRRDANFADSIRLDNSDSLSVRSVDSYLIRCLDAVMQLDARHLESELEEGLIGLGSVSFLTRLIEPLMQQVGDLWRNGEVRTCQEHFASAHIRSFLGRLMVDANTDPTGPRILVATPPGHLHEIGAAMAAVMAALSGWNVIYLGPNVPCEEILFAAECKAVKVVALSLTYPGDDASIPGFLKQLTRQLPEPISLLVGGASAADYRETLRLVNAEEIDALGDFAHRLDALRRP